MGQKLRTWNRRAEALRGLDWAVLALCMGLVTLVSAFHEPWRDEAKAKERVFTICLADSPEPARSHREWNKLSESIPKNEELRVMLENPEILLHTEIPFLWPGAKNLSVEGVIDLALFDPAAKRWLILDWKTNRIDARDAEGLRGQYLAQVAAYWKGVKEMTGAPVRAQIYSTATGHFIDYGSDELESEWERLKQLPVDELMSARRIA
jgi:ATP-dependent exoDNAse (exonuclease V) beta subunit